MSDIAANLARLRREIVDAAKASGRAANEIELIAVSKTQPLDKIRDAIAAQQRHFGENYLQEALDKIHALTDHALTWHFIGPIQSNKTRDIAAHFDWVHSVDRFKIARRLAEQRPPELSPLNICLQVNISGEDTKSGLAPVDVQPLARDISALKNLRLRGLMAIPAPAHSFEDQRKPFAALRELKAALAGEHPDMDTLSMGMSDDLQAAIAESATLVRIGTAIFGSRNT